MPSDFWVERGPGVWWESTGLSLSMRTTDSPWGFSPLRPQSPAPAQSGSSPGGRQVAGLGPSLTDFGSGFGLIITCFVTLTRHIHS